MVGPVEVHLTLAGTVDTAAERQRMEKELAEAEFAHPAAGEAVRSDFAGKAPPQVVAKEREKLAAYRLTADKIKAQLQDQ